MDHPFHPAANIYPLMDESQLADLAETIRVNGLRSRIVARDGLILDGRNRYLAIKLLGYATIPPEWQDEIDVADEDIPALIEDLNEHRRHLTPEWLTEHRRLRISRVAEKRREGKSQRQIAEEEGVSRAQVVSDLEHATGQGGCPVEPEGGKVTGRDNRTRTAKPKPKGPKKTPKRQPMSDALGNTVPDNLRDVFADPYLPQFIQKLEAWINDAPPDMPEGLKSRSRFYPFASVPDYHKHMKEAVRAAHMALEALRAGTPDVVCQECGGEGCKQCRLGGHVPQWRHEERAAQRQLEGKAS